jgi:heptosyltransferase-2
MMNKILIIQTASIGDVILATPLLEALKHHYPDSTLDILVKKGNETLFRNHPFLNKVITWDKNRAKYLHLLDLCLRVRRERYDLVINLQRFFATGLITVVSGGKITIGFDKNPLSRYFNRSIEHSIHLGKKHETARNLSLIEPLIGPVYFPVRLYPSRKDYERVSKYKKEPYITISPASIWFTKQYPAVKWVEFLKSLKEKIMVYTLGSASDQRLCQEILDVAEYRKSENLAGKLDLLESAAMMKDARRNLVNDSAPMHLASAVNARTTAIFCSTITAFGFGPLSDDSIVVETEKKLSCRPCGIHGRKACPEKHFKCAHTIQNKHLLYGI